MLGSYGPQLALVSKGGGTMDDDLMKCIRSFFGMESGQLSPPKPSCINCRFSVECLMPQTEICDNWDSISFRILLLD